MTLYDVSLLIRPELAGWPGDTEFSQKWEMRLADGESVNLSGITISLHFGTHVDAPLHFAEAGKTIAELPLSSFIGPAHLLDVQGHSVISVELLRELDFADTPRLLLRTGGWQDYSQFPERIPVIHDEVPAYLQAQGVCLLGLDVPSVDQIDSKDLPIHHALHQAGILFIESLQLSEPPPGRYQLTALPLKLANADASPVRAILESLD